MSLTMKKIKAFGIVLKFNILYFIFAAFVLDGCSSSTFITASWKSPSQSTQKYNRILAAALTRNTIAKSTVEDAMATALTANLNVSVVKSIDELPPDITNADTDKATIMNKVKDKNIDAILTISLIDKETESRYVPGGGLYDPIGGFGYYGNFRGYYNYWYPYAYTQGYYVEEKIYFIETNLYDALTEKLVWSAQSKTYDPSDLKTFSKDFATTIAMKMKTDGIFNTAKPTETLPNAER
jgi:hypothetical protein